MANKLKTTIKCKPLLTEGNIDIINHLGDLRKWFF